MARVRISLKSLCQKPYITKTEKELEQRQRETRGEGGRGNAGGCPIKRQPHCKGLSPQGALVKTEGVDSCSVGTLSGRI